MRPLLPALSLRLPLPALLLAAAALMVPHLARAEHPLLENDHLTVQFDTAGMAAIVDRALGEVVPLGEDRFTLALDGQSIHSSELELDRIDQTDGEVVYRFRIPGGTVEAVYELQPQWRFVSKHLRFQPQGDRWLDQVTVLDARWSAAAVDRLNLRSGLLLRFASGPEEMPSWSLFAEIQTPYNRVTLDDGRLTLGYEPQMPWQASWGRFESDRVLLGTCALSGHRYPWHMVPEWHYLPDPDAHGRDGPWIDIEEVLAVTAAVEAFTTYRPTRSSRLHVDWCENAYQIDISTPEGWEEYRRIVARAADVGCDTILFSPQDLELNSLAENRDAWGWESLLWLNLGQKLRKGEWRAGIDPLPAAVQDRIDYARRHGIRLVAYVYPTLPFLQDPEWTAWVRDLEGSPEPGGYRGADTGIRSFQDWLLEQLVRFQRQTDGGGFSFDHWWIAYTEPGTTSLYAQWYGCRRILNELRRRCPEIVVDGRQQYHHFGQWTWVGGSFPHPLDSDEQPQSFRSFADLHWSRGSAARQRYVSWRFRVRQFTPVVLMPGYMTHQTMRIDKDGVMRRDRYRTADWDYLGWKYSVISSLATAPVNHVVNYLPARNLAEFEHFSAADQRWFRDWLDWTDHHFELLQRLRPIIGQPMVGRCDGTAAIDGDRGFVFLFNPNYRRLDATFTLDGSIGLSEGERFVFRQLYPDLGRGRLIAPPQRGYYERGESVTWAMDGASALVVELLPLEALEEGPWLLGAVGSAAVDDGVLHLSGVQGEMGTLQTLAVRLDDPAELRGVQIDGTAVPFTQQQTLVTIPLRFAGTRFAQCQQIGSYDPSFDAATFSGTFRVPQRILDQLEARRQAWPIPYDEDELAATWNAPWRMLLFINIADPRPEMEASMTLNGEPVEVRRAYSSVYPDVVDHTFLGFYVDLTDAIEAEREYRIEVALPAGLEPGRFQGVFFDNIEPEYTAEFAPADE